MPTTNSSCSESAKESGAGEEYLSWAKRMKKKMIDDDDDERGSSVRKAHIVQHNYCENFTHRPAGHRTVVPRERRNQPTAIAAVHGMYSRSSPVP